MYREWHLRATRMTTHLRCVGAERPCDRQEQVGPPAEETRPRRRLCPDVRERVGAEAETGFGKKVSGWRRHWRTWNWQCHDCIEQFAVKRQPRRRRHDMED